VEEEVVFNFLWKNPAPLKVLAFSWTLRLDRIPTRDNLDKRRLLDAEASRLCCFCESAVETSRHLFLHCQVTYKVWLRVMKFIEVSLLTPPNLSIHLSCWTNEVRGKKHKRSASIIWHVTVWVIWIRRNDRLLNNKAVEVDDIVEQKIKMLSWH